LKKLLEILQAFSPFLVYEKMHVQGWKCSDWGQK
jgi:hypothetical protein